jgi:hypothetical protein
VRTCVSNRDTEPPIQKLLHAVDILCFSYYEACQRKKRANSWSDCHSRIECLDSKSAIQNLLGFRACNCQHFSLASGRVVFSSCGADPRNTKKRLPSPALEPFPLWTRPEVISYCPGVNTPPPRRGSAWGPTSYQGARPLPPGPFGGEGPRPGAGPVGCKSRLPGCAPAPAAPAPPPGPIGGVPATGYRLWARSSQRLRSAFDSAHHRPQYAVGGGQRVVRSRLCNLMRIMIIHTISSTRMEPAISSTSTRIQNGAHLLLVLVALLLILH